MGKLGRHWQGHVQLGKLGPNFFFLKDLVMFRPPTGSELAVGRIQKSFF